MSCDQKELRRSDLSLDSTKESVLFENLITKNELANRLSVSVSLINKLMVETDIPRFKLGRSVRFDTGEVTAWLQQRRML